MNLTSGALFATLHFLTFGPNMIVLHNTRLERLVRNRHSSLLDLLLSYEENEVFWILHQVTKWSKALAVSTGAFATTMLYTANVNDP